MPATPTFFARRDGIFSEDIHEEVLVYDTRADAAHCLSETAAVAWRTCDGGATLDEIAEQLIARDVADSSEAAAELADMAVAELIEKRLLDTSGVEVSAGVSRRQALRRIAGVGGAAIMGPLIVSAAIPSSAAALGSCVGLGLVCTTGQTCCASGSITIPCTSGHCCLTNTSTCTASDQCCSSIGGNGNKCPQGVCKS